MKHGAVEILGDVMRIKLDYLNGCSVILGEKYLYIVDIESCLNKFISTLVTHTELGDHI